MSGECYCGAPHEACEYKCGYCGALLCFHCKGPLHHDCPGWDGVTGTESYDDAD